MRPARKRLYRTGNGIDKKAISFPGLKGQNQPADRANSDLNAFESLTRHSKGRRLIFMPAGKCLKLQ
jgi:hypothetical protein